MSRILVADDEPAICDAFTRMLAQDGHETLIASNGQQAVEIAERERLDGIFLDVRMPGLDGLTALGRIRAADPDVPVVVMTAHGTLDTAMEALRLGAFDYLGKPLDLGRIRALLARMLHRYEPVEPSAGHDRAGSVAGPTDEPRLIGQSAPMQEVFKLMALVADNDLGILILGESGVGKELVARDIHRFGARRERPFVAVSCGAIPENLLESELFGHERGAFTGASERRIGRFEAAGAGTLFLDEIGELPALLQVKLLRAIQERRYERVGSNQSLPIEARLIAATNRDLGAEVTAGRFREDLYHRLNLVTLRIPPLRHRHEDIPLLAGTFLARAAARLGRQVQGIEPSAMDALMQYPWPGNVRELEHLISRSVLACRGPMLGQHDLAFDTGSRPPEQDTTDPLAGLARAARQALDTLIATGDTAAEGPFHRIVSRVEWELIDEALRRSSGNQVAASRLLDLHRTTLRKKIRPQG